MWFFLKHEIEILNVKAVSTSPLFPHHVCLEQWAKRRQLGLPGRESGCSRGRQRVKPPVTGPLTSGLLGGPAADMGSWRQGLLDKSVYWQKTLISLGPSCSYRPLPIFPREVSDVMTEDRLVCPSSHSPYIPGLPSSLFIKDTLPSHSPTPSLQLHPPTHAHTPVPSWPQTFPGERCQWLSGPALIWMARVGSDLRPSSATWRKWGTRFSW